MIKHLIRKGVLFFSDASPLITVTITTLITGFILIIRFNLIQTYITDLAGIEQNVIYGIQRIILNKDLYTDPEKPPFAIIQYSPLYYYICAFIVKILNLYSEPGDLHKIYVISRSLSLFFGILCSYIFFYITQRHFSSKKFISLVGAFLVFIFQYEHHYAARPDSLLDACLLLIILMILEFYTASVKSKWLYIYGIVFLSFMAVLIKQSGIQIIILLVAFFILKQDKVVVIHVLATTIVFSLIFFFINKIVFGDFFYKNVIDGIINGINISPMHKRILNRKEYYYVLALLCFILIRAIKGSLETRLSFQEQLLLFISFGMFVFAFGISLKTGSTIQYFSSFQNTALLAFFCYVTQHKKEDYNFNISFAVICITLFTFRGIDYFFYRNYQYLSTSYKTNNQELKADYNEQKKVSEYIAGRIKPDEYIVVQQGLIAGYFNTTQYTLVPQQDILACCSYPLGVYNYSVLKSLIDQGKIKYIVLSKGSEMPIIAGLSFSEYSYKPHIDIGKYTIFEFK